jgi:predicted phage terminase large subunit-like protein
VGVKLAIHTDPVTADMTYIITDVRRIRGGPEKVRQLVKETALSDGPSVSIFVPEDPGSAGKDQAHSFVDMLRGYPVTPVRQTGDKETRARVMAAQCNIGKCGMLKGPWNMAYTAELAAFPNAQFDDQVDASTLVFNQAVGPGGTLARWLRL